MNHLELTGLAERLRRLEEALEAVPRAAAGGGGWREPEDADKDGLAVGDIKMAGRIDDHTANGHEWLLCNGRSLSRAGYADLFAVLGVAFGPGDGSTTFEIPDLVSDHGSPDSYPRVPVGAGAPGAPKALGAKGGFGTHTHSANSAQTGDAGTQLGHQYTGPTGENSNPTGQIIAAGTDYSVAGHPHTHGGAPLADHPSTSTHSHPSGSITVDSEVHLPPYQAVGFFILAGK